MKSLCLFCSLNFYNYFFLLFFRKVDNFLRSDFFSSGFHNPNYQEIKKDLISKFPNVPKYLNWKLSNFLIFLIFFYSSLFLWEFFGGHNGLYQTRKQIKDTFPIVYSYFPFFFHFPLFLPFFQKFSVLQPEYTYIPAYL